MVHAMVPAAINCEGGRVGPDLTVEAGLQPKTKEEARQAKEGHREFGPEQGMLQTRIVRCPVKTTLAKLASHPASLTASQRCGAR